MPTLQMSAAAPSYPPFLTPHSEWRSITSGAKYLVHGQRYGETICRNSVLGGSAECLTALQTNLQNDTGPLRHRAASLRLPGRIRAMADAQLAIYV